MIFNAPSATTGGTLTVTAPAGVTVTVSKDGKTKTRVVNSSGIAVFKGLASGTWTVTITGDGKTAQKTVTITTDYSTAISFNAIPEFTYTGDFEIVSDDDQPITVSQDNWKIRFLTSGVLTFTSLNGAEGGIDVFLVGGGGSGGQWCDGGSDGGGGGGGYTKTSKGVLVEINTPYDIVVGAGGTRQTGENKVGHAGGASSAFSITANGGKGGKAWDDEEDAKGYGAGGSGGGSGNTDSNIGGAGGHDGSNGGAGYWSAGIGQSTTTREFGDSTGTLYSGGGAGSRNNSTAAGGGGKTGSDGAVNTGGGGGGGWNDSREVNAGAGGSGIVIIRNAREVA